MAGKLNTNQIEEIAEDEIAQALKTLKKLQFKKGARFSVDSKGNTTKNYKDGGLAMAIEKVKAKEMKLGGVAKPKSKPKNFKKIVQKQKRDRAIADGDMVIGDFNEMTPSMMQDFYKNASKVKEMELGGEAVPSKFKGFSKLPEDVQEKINPKLASKYEKGGKVEKYRGGGKVKGGKMGCRGMGAALRGGGYTIS